MKTERNPKDKAKKKMDILKNPSLNLVRCLFKYEQSELEAIRLSDFFLKKSKPFCVQEAMVVGMVVSVDGSVGV